MAGETLSVKRVEPQPSCVRKSTARATFSNMKREGEKRGRVCTVQHVRNVCASTRHLLQRRAGMTHDGVKVTFWGRGPCKDNAVAEAKTTESVKKRFFFFPLLVCFVSQCGFLAGWLGSWFPVENEWLATSFCKLSNIFQPSGLVYWSFLLLTH